MPVERALRIRVSHRVGGPLLDDAGDPVSHVSADVGQLGAALLAELVEEHVEGGVVAAGAGPHQRAGVVVDDDDQVAVPALVGDLVDPDPAQPIEAVHDGVDIGVDPGDDRPDGPPCDPQELAHRRLRRAHGEPGGQVIEVPGVAGVVPGPRDRGDGRPVRSALDPGGVGLEEHLRRPEIQGPPPSTAFTVVVAR